MSNIKIPELLAPAGNMTKLKMALAYGADAVYAGAAGFSMRPDKASFTETEFAQAVDYTHNLGKKFYAAINTMMFDDDLEQIRVWLEETKSLPFDAVIVSDAGLFNLVKEVRPELEIHISTQMSIANTGAASFWKNAGASRIILARECSLQQVKEIVDKSGVKIEIFVHGAMCVAVSGRCLLSAHLIGSSGSQGECKHSCRWEWQLVEQKRPGETFPIYETGRETFLMGSTDLCLIEHLPEVLGTGISSLKIEGRMKGEYYIAVVTKVYREALDRYANNRESFTVNPEWLEELESVSHRPYGTGFAFGYPKDYPHSLQTSSKPVSTAITHGFVKEIKKEGNLIVVKNPFDRGDELEWFSPGGSSGKAVARSFYNPFGHPLERALSSTETIVEFEDGIELPPFSLLRRKKG